MATHDELVNAAHVVAEDIRAVARRCEIERRTDDAVIAKARELGLFSLMSPRCYGGSELDLDTFFEVGLILGRADASHAWVMNFYIEHVWMFTQFPSAFQTSLFADRSDVIAPAILAPTGRAEAVEGGYVIGGRFPWGTGIAHAEWVIVGSMVDTDGLLLPWFFALPADDVVVEDTWYMDGMCATASNEIVIADQLIPEERAISFMDMLDAKAPGSEIHVGPLYSTPMAPILSFAAALPALGQAREMVDEFGAQLATRKDMLTGEPQTLNVSRQMLLGRARLEVDAAEALMRKVLSETMAQRGAAELETRVRWSAAIAHAVTMCRKTIESLAEAAGATAHQLDNRLQRARRDVATISCHTVFDVDERNRCLGSTLLGLEPGSRWH